MPDLLLSKDEIAKLNKLVDNCPRREWSPREIVHVWMNYDIDMLVGAANALPKLLADDLTLQDENEKLWAILDRVTSPVTNHLTAMDDAQALLDEIEALRTASGR